MSGPRPGSGPRLRPGLLRERPAAIVESWTLTLARRDGTWSVTALDIPGNPTRLYKIGLPAERVVRARRIEVVHTDIRLSFEDAAVYLRQHPRRRYGHDHRRHAARSFSPSDANEKHRWSSSTSGTGSRTIDSLYIRASRTSLPRTSAWTPRTGRPRSRTAERAKAASVFARNYPRSFTIENSFDGTLLSFLPRNEETVLEFRGRRTGELAYVYFPFADEEVSLYDDKRSASSASTAPTRKGASP